MHSLRPRVLPYGPRGEAVTTKLTDPRPVPGWSAYLVYPDGRVWSLTWRRFLKPCLNRKGYVQVRLTMDGRHRSTTVHRLVAETFLGVQPGTPVNHIDGVKTNNDVSNLEATTEAENHAHAVRLNLTPRGERVHGARLTESQVSEIRRLNSIGVAKKVLARQYQVDPSAIRQLIRRRTWRHVA